MRILVTGATGYIGGAVAQRLRRDGHDVTGAARSELAATTLKAAGFDTAHVDLDDAESLRQATLDVDAVVDAANCDHHASTVALLDALEGTGKQFLRASGTGVYSDFAHGEPSDVIHTENDGFEPVGPLAARYRTDMLTRDAAARNIHSVVLRFPLIYGHGASLQVPVMLRGALRSGFSGYTGPGLNRYGTIYIDDAALAFSLALTEAPSGSIYNVSTDEADFRSIAEVIGDMLDLPARSFTNDDEAYRVQSFAWAVGLACNSRVNSALARDELGWTPTGPRLFEEIAQGSYRRIWGQNVIALESS